VFNKFIIQHLINDVFYLHGRRSDYDHDDPIDLILPTGHAPLTRIGLPRLSVRVVAIRIGYSIGTSTGSAVSTP
jgi:hypothetical protein